MVVVILERCQRCKTGAMTSYIDKGEGICMNCGWVHYVKEPPEQIPENVEKKRGRPKGYTSRLD